LFSIYFFVGSFFVSGFVSVLASPGFLSLGFLSFSSNVVPTIQGRDFVVATVASPTVVVEPEKPAEETAVEGEEASVEDEGEVKTAEENTKLDEKDKKPSDKKPGDAKTETKPETKKEPTKK
jgi:hypothetical protein